jgi:hypothetical protein
VPCPCGCGDLRSPRGRRPLAAPGSRLVRRALGAFTLTASDVANNSYVKSIAPGAGGLVFQAETIAGDAANDVNTATQLMSTFDNSKVDLTGAQAKAQTEAIAKGLMYIPVVGTAIGGTILAITNAVGYAHAGAGLCASSAPATQGYGDLKAWPHYQGWAGSTADAAPRGQGWFEGKDAAGSFEDVANRALAYNRALQDNCYSNVMVPFPLLLAQIVTAWNGTHKGPPRLVSRRLTSGAIGSTAPGYDPISYALEQADDGRAAGKTITFPVNTGPQVKVVHLRLPSAASQAADRAAAPAPPSFPSAPAGSGVVFLAVSAAGLWWVYSQNKKHRPIVPGSLGRFFR